ncbi:uncharacterized protein BKA78DRAFT_43561 [Phyllosticta capitalensis]|uniref:uncharacterized protein n=1 Tax=Phyllosticta capitalensis TaxID=121624 RepID=UPI00312EA554
MLSEGLSSHASCNPSRLVNVVDLITATRLVRSPHLSSPRLHNLPTDTVRTFSLHSPSLPAPKGPSPAPCADLLHLCCTSSPPSSSFFVFLCIAASARGAHRSANWQQHHQQPHTRGPCADQGYTQPSLRAAKERGLGPFHNISRRVSVPFFDAQLYLAA